jgi:hypothetical protein
MESYHLRQTPRRDNVPRMYQAIQMPCRLLYLFPHVIVTLKVEDICNKVERVLVVLDFGIEAGKVEAIGKILFVDFAKVLVST